MIAAAENLRFVVDHHDPSQRHDVIVVVIPAIKQTMLEAPFVPRFIARADRMAWITAHFAVPVQKRLLTYNDITKGNVSKR